MDTTKTKKFLAICEEFGIEKGLVRNMKRDLVNKIKNEILLYKRDKEGGCFCCHTEIARNRQKYLTSILKEVEELG